jgi:hypothetical protein
MKGLTMASVNGNEIDKTVRCQFCGREMRQGSSRLGSGVNTLSYWCECGTAAMFSHSYEKKIKEIESTFKFED